MSDLTVELDDAVVAKLKDRAARKGISLNEEVLATLREAVRSDPPSGKNAPRPSERQLTEAEVAERLRRLKALARRPLTPVDLKALSDELSDPIG